jgi:glc operon protein GlcG
MRLLTFVLLLSGIPLALGADVANRPALTLDGAKRVAAAAAAYARAHNAPGASIAIVDAGGHTIYLERLDGTFPASADVSIGKARTAANFMRATRGMEDSINQGRTALASVTAVTPFTPLQGGIPIMLGKQIVGAIGVSGAASAQQDEEIAIAGAQAVHE